MIMEDIRIDKITRILGIYTKLINGNLINKSKEAQAYGVNERSIQRDIEDIRAYLENSNAEIGYINNVVYDRVNKGYRLEQLSRINLTNSEVLAVCKILLDSRAFTRNEMENIISNLIS